MWCVCVRIAPICVRDMALNYVENQIANNEEESKKSTPCARGKFSHPCRIGKPQEISKDRDTDGGSAFRAVTADWLGSQVV